jgi:hypothetical protein
MERADTATHLGIKKDMSKTGTKEVVTDIIHIAR